MLPPHLQREANTIDLQMNLLRVESDRDALRAQAKRLRTGFTWKRRVLKILMISGALVGVVAVSMKAMHGVP